MTQESARQNVHATGLCINGKGLMLRGPSGAGKSLLTLELLQAAQDRGQDAALIADDRLDVEISKTQLIAHAPANIGGLIELRGWGIVSRAHVPSARIHLVVDLVDELERMLEEDALVTTILGVTLARCPVPRRDMADSAHQRLLIGEALSRL